MAGRYAVRQPGWVVENSEQHGYEAWTLMRHLPLFRRPSYLRYRPRRYPGLEREGHPTAQSDWIGDSRCPIWSFFQRIFLDLEGYRLFAG
jgi:transposase